MSDLKLTLFITVLTTLLLATSLHAEPVPAGSDDEIRARLAPFGNLCRAGDECAAVTAEVAGGPKSGEAVYNQFCFACHATGVSEAPLFADSESWAPRLAKGMDVMLANTLNGLGMMPPKGTCMDCSDDELQAAVDFMLEQVQ